jgi:hypothetical protein
MPHTTAVRFEVVDLCFRRSPRLFCCFWKSTKIASYLFRQSSRIAESGGDLNFNGRLFHDLGERPDSVRISIRSTRTASAFACKALSFCRTIAVLRYLLQFILGAEDAPVDRSPTNLSNEQINHVVAANHDFLGWDRMP